MGQRSSHAGPTFSRCPQPTTTITPHAIPDPTPPPIPNTAPPLPPSQPNQMHLTHTTRPHIPLDPTTKSNNSLAPENQTPYRLSLITNAKATAQNFLGKFFFGDSVVTRILPPVKSTTAMHRDKIFDLTTGKTLWLLTH